MIGTTISHYKITDEIGRGGMGVVYKAEDTKLDRTVALKFFPPHALVTDDDRARFYREARAAAALHHPNIATVFEIDEVPLATDSGIPTEGGISSGSSLRTTPLIAMEYIEGETLTDRIAQGPLALKDVISIATQAAQALKAAHAKDIVHRDVKSGNIMLTSDGQAKMLDFGLAKTAASTKLTQMGSTLGTAAYMSPEQARGEEVDGRSDLWSLGGVIYEMITGRVPFPGDYEQAIVYGILNSEPEPPTAMRTGVPMAMEWVVTKLLTKDREKRYQSAGEVIVDLGRVDMDSTSTMTTVRTASPGMSAPRSARSIPYLAMAAGIAATLLIGAAGAWLLSGRSTEQAPLHLQLSIPQQAGGSVIRTDFGSAIALSPNGRRLVFTGDMDGRGMLFMQDFGDDSGPIPIEGTESGRSPVFSPDGSSIVFVTGVMLKKVSLRGGAPRNVVPGGGEYPSYSWSNEDEIVYVPSYGDGIYRVEASGGESELLVEPDIEKGEVGFTYPQILPGGRYLLCGSYGSGYRIVVVDLTDRSRTTLFEGGIAPTYLSDGYVVFAQKKSLLVASFDVDNLAVGDPVVIIDGLLSDFDTITSNYSVSASGSLAYLTGTTIWDRDLMEIDRAGNRQVIQTDRRGFNRIILSPDGSMLATQAGSGLEEADLMIVDLGNGDAQRFAPSPAWEAPGFWLPDGSGLVFSSERRGSADVYLAKLGDPGEPSALVANEYSKYAGSVTADGRLVAYNEIHPETGSDIWLVSTEGSEPPRPFLRSPASEDDPAISPDGRHIAYTSDESGRAEVYVAATESAGRRVKVSREGGSEPEWIRSGRGLLYREGRSIMEVDVSDGGRSFSAPRKVFDGVDRWTPRSDGSAIITRSAVSTPQLHLVLGWADELKRQVPSG